MTKDEEKQLLGILAHEAFPGINMDEVRVINVPPSRFHEHILSTVQEKDTVADEVVTLVKYAVFIRFGYGKKTKTLVVESTSMREMPQY